MAVISIDYNDVDASTYQGVHLTYNNCEKTDIFNTGNFCVDWNSAKRRYMEIMDDEPYLSASSSVDHFFMDGAKFDSAYLCFDNNLPVLKYLDRTDKNWIHTQSHIYENGWEFFVDKGTKPTWEEFKLLYNK